MKIITSDRIAEATVGSFENRSDDAEFPFPFPSFPTTFGSSQAVKQKEGKKMEMTMEQVVLTLASAASVLLLLLAANRWISVCVQCTHALTHSLTDGVCVLGSISRRRRRWRRWKRKMERKTNRSQNTHTHCTNTDWLRWHKSGGHKEWRKKKGKESTDSHLEPTRKQNEGQTEEEVWFTPIRALAQSFSFSFWASVKWWMTLKMCVCACWSVVIRRRRSGRWRWPRHWQLSQSWAVLFTDPPLKCGHCCCC